MHIIRRTLSESKRFTGSLCAIRENPQDMVCAKLKPVRRLARHPCPLNGFLALLIVPYHHLIPGLPAEHRLHLVESRAAGQQRKGPAAGRPAGAAVRRALRARPPMFVGVGPAVACPVSHAIDCTDWGGEKFLGWIGGFVIQFLTCHTK